MRRRLPRSARASMTENTYQMTNLNRRDFGKIALASLPASMAFGKINSTFSGVKIGAQSYCFRTMPLDEALKAFVDCGIGECELFGPHAEKAAGAPASTPGRRPTPEDREALAKWRTTVSMDHGSVSTSTRCS